MAYVSTPAAIVTAQRLAFYDVPRDYKGHQRPTPYLGGAAVVLAFILAALVGAGHLTSTLPMLGGVVLLWAIGTIDDRRTVSPWLRVVAELVLGASISLAGLGWRLGAGGAVDAVVMAIWVVAVVNAINLFDNMDGAASSITVVVAGGAGVLALFTHEHWVSIGSAALCGACMGFLPHNLARPARIFLGDGGSMPLGFAAAVLVASAANGAEPSLLAMLVGFLLVGIPALDTVLVIVSRRRRGVSVLTGGQDHLTHRTRRRMRTAHRVVLVLAGAQAVVSALVIVATRESSATLVYMVLAFVVCAVAAVVGFEKRQLVPEPQVLSATDHEPTAVSVQESRRGNLTALVVIAVLGVGAGLSALFSAYYDIGIWVPLGLLVTIVAAIAAVARPPRATLPMTLALLGLGGLGLWSLLSTSWAAAAEAATVDANRWLSYVALFVLLVVLLPARSRVKALLSAVGLGIAVVAVTVLVRMLGSDPGSLFLAGRLNSPLGYINGEGCLFAMGACGALALAERREAIVAGLGAGAAVALASLAVLSQSRGAAIAIALALLVLLLVVPGRRRRILALAAIGASFAIAAGPVLRVYSSGSAAAIPASVAHHAALAIIAASLAAGIVWGLVVAAAGALERNPSHSLALRRLATGLALALVLLPLIAAAVKMPAIQRTASRQWHAFVHLSDAGSSSAASQTRLLSGGGNRYDYWRVAWHAFESHPLAGIGAGNYPAAYFQQRTTEESIQNPHSIGLQTLSELGLVGLGLLIALLAGIAMGATRLRRVARTSSLARTVLVATLGAFVVWLVDASGDWMHLLPGLTAIALAAAAILCRDWRPGSGIHRSDTDRLAPGIPLLIGAAAMAFLLAVAGAGLARAVLARHFLDNARTELAARPAAAITDARRVLRLDSANLDAYYVEAAGEARFDDATGAYATLRAAARQDPSSFVTWTLLGDLEVRLRNFAAARPFYGRAHELDPRDPMLAKLARHPSAALSSAGR